MHFLKTLDFSYVILNGHTITGWSEDEAALTLPDSIEYATVKFGADGHMGASGTSVRGGEMTIKLLPESPSVQFLQNILLAQKHSGYMKFTGTIRFNDDSLITLGNGIITKGPMGFNLGKGAAASMVYTFAFGVMDFEMITTKQAEQK